MKAACRSLLIEVAIGLMMAMAVSETAHAMGRAPDFEVGTAGYSAPNWPSSSPDDMQEFWDDVDELGTFFGVHTWWNESGDGSIPGTVEYAYAMGQRPVIVLGIRDAVGDPAKVAALETMLASLVQTYPVEYLGLGNEIDDVADFEATASLVEDLTALVHALGTGTRVFTVFQYERMLQRADAAAMVARLPTLDVVGFTSYPFLLHTTTSDVPKRYYDPVSDWTSKPIVLTEIGWVTRHNHPGYSWIQGSETEQAAFVQLFRDRLAPRLNLELANWAFVHDFADWSENDPIQSFAHIFASCALGRNAPGEHKPAYAEWKKLHDDSVAAH